MEVPGRWRATGRCEHESAERGDGEAVYSRCVGGARRVAGNGPVRSLQVGSRLVTGRREQSGIANNRPRDCVINNNAMGAQAKCRQYLVNSCDRCEICEAELILMPALRDHLRPLVE